MLVIGSSFVNSLNWALVADAVEYGEYKTGVRAEGIVYSFFTFFRKCSQAVAGFVPGLVLTMVGYVPNAVQSLEALEGIRGLMFIYPKKATQENKINIVGSVTNK